MQTRPPKRPVTFRHMLNHSGGLTYGGSLLPDGSPVHPVDQVYQQVKVGRGGSDPIETFIEKLGQVPLRYEPGEAWHYSLSTDVCGYLVQALSGMPFDRFVKQRILDPLGMKDTAFTIAPEKVERLAACYRRGADKKLVLSDDPGRSSYAKAPGFPSGGGGLLSTMADYHRFTEMLRRGGELDGVRILGPRTLAMMHMNHLPDGKDLTSLAIGAFSETTNEGVGFGLGFASTQGQVATGSYGAGDYFWGGMASTIFWVDPAEDLVVIFLTQLIPSGTFNFRGQLKNLVYSAITD
jgi:CubicO group peptidase (beta-lactamase class C family)